MQFMKNAERFITDNSPLLLTSLGVTGVFVTGVLSAKAGKNAAILLDDPELPVMSRKEEILYVWREFAPAFVVGGTTVACIIGANRIGTRRAAALASAFTVSERAAKEYREKMVEKLGEKKEREYHDEVVADRVTKQDVIVMGEGGLCYDMYSGRFFENISVEDIKKAQNDTNHQRLNENYASLNDFYRKLGVETTSAGEEVGWNLDKECEVIIGATIKEGRPVITMDFFVQPIRGYYRIH